MDRKARIQGALVARGCSQRTVASACGVSEATVSKILAGAYAQRSVRSRRTRHRVLLEIARQSGLALEELQALTAPSAAPAAA